MTRNEGVHTRAEDLMVHVQCLYYSVIDPKTLETLKQLLKHTINPVNEYNATH